MKSILKHFSAYSVGLLISVPLAFVSLFLITKYLGPELYGVFALLSLFLLYSRYFDFGISRGILKEIPKTKNKNRINSLFWNSVTFVSVLYIVLIFCLFVLVKLTGFLSQYGYLFILVLAVMLFQQIWFIFENYLKATKNINTLTKAIVFMPLIKIPLVILLVKKLSLSGAIIVLLLVYVVTIFYMKFAGKIAFKFEASKKILFKLLKTGFPILVIDLVVFLLLTLDKVFISQFLGTEQLGYYNIGFLVINYFIFLPTAIGFILLPHMIENTKKHAAEYYLKSVYAFSYVSPAIFGVLFLFIPAVITAYLPEFIPAIQPLKLMIIAAFFFSLSIIGNNYLIAANLQKKLIFMQIFSILTLVILDIVALLLGYGIDVIASITLFVYLLLSKKVMFLCITNAGVKNRAVFILRQYIPLLFMAVLCVLLQKAATIVTFGDQMFILAMQLVVFVLIYGAFFFHIHKKTPILPKKHLNP